MTRVLVVDDDSTVRMAARLHLEIDGIEVLESMDGAAALLNVRDSGPDVVLCDLFMPGVDGLELIRELRRSHSGVKIIAMSGGGFDGTVDLLPVARLLGADEVLTKPLGHAALMAALKRVVSSPAGDT